MRSIAGAVITAAAFIVYTAAASLGFDRIAVFLGAATMIAGIGVNAWMKSGGSY